MLKRNFSETYLQNLNSEINIKNVTVIGGGAMGAGIAQAAAQNGFQVTVVDNDEFGQKCLVQISRSLDIIA